MPLYLCIKLLYLLNLQHISSALYHSQLFYYIPMYHAQLFKMTGILLCIMKKCIVPVPFQSCITGRVLSVTGNPRYSNKEAER